MWNCNATAIEQRMARAATDGVHEIAGFTFDPSATCSWSVHYNISMCYCTRAWLPAARKWLSGTT
jgi:hypothetical protein